MPLWSPHLTALDLFCVLTNNLCTTIYTDMPASHASSLASEVFAKFQEAPASINQANDSNEKEKKNALVKNLG